MSVKIRNIQLRAAGDGQPDESSQDASSITLNLQALTKCQYGNSVFRRVQDKHSLMFGINEMLSKRSERLCEVTDACMDSHTAMMR